MADTNNLTNFLGDVADAIRAKTGNNDPIPAANFDTEIANIATGTELPDGIYIQNSMPTKNTTEAFWLYELSGDKASDLIPPETMIGSSISFGQIKSALIGQSLLNDFDDAYYHVFAVSYGGNRASVAFSNNAYRVYSSYGANYTYVGNGTDYVWACNFSFNNADPNNLIFNNQGQVGYWSNANYQSWGIDFCDKDILYSNGVLWRAANELGGNQDGLSINVGNEQYVVYQSEAGINTFNKILNSQGMNATSSDILPGKTAIVNNQKLIGNMAVNTTTITPSMVSQAINNGYYANSNIAPISDTNEYKNWNETAMNVLGETAITTIEYIQSNGAQYIMTNIIPSATTRTEIEFQYTSDTATASDDRVFDTQNAQPYLLFGRCTNGSATKFRYVDGDGTGSHVQWLDKDTNKHTLILSADAKLDNTVIVSTVAYNNVSIMLCGNGRPDGGFYSKGLKIYSIKHYDVNNDLLYSLIPAKDNNGVVCMYDEVNDTYYYNQGSGNFIAGPEYTEIEYIEFTGTQYINTNIIPSNHTAITEFDFGEYNNDEHLFGTNAGAGYYHFTPYNNAYYWGYNGSEGHAGTWTTGKHILEYNGDNYKIKLDDTILGQGINTVSSSALWIGKRESAINLYAKIYSFKMYDKSTNTLVLDLIPVKDENNVACMYDRISKTYFRNAGTGSFVAGPNVSNKSLAQNLNTILQEKITKIVPENIVNGVTIFDVTGNFTGGEDLSNVLNEQDSLITNLQNEINTLSAALNNAAGGGSIDYNSRYSDEINTLNVFSSYIANDTFDYMYHNFEQAYGAATYPENIIPWHAFRYYNNVPLNNVFNTSVANGVYFLINYDVVGYNIDCFWVEINTANGCFDIYLSATDPEISRNIANGTIFANLDFESQYTMEFQYIPIPNTNNIGWCLKGYDSNIGEDTYQELNYEGFCDMCKVINRYEDTIIADNAWSSTSVSLAYNAQSMNTRNWIYIFNNPNLDVNMIPIVSNEISKMFTIGLVNIS